MTIIHLAAHHGKKDILERAVTFYPPTPSADEPEEITIDPLLATDKLGRCALHYAASEGRSNVVSWILERMGPDPSSHPQVQTFHGNTLSMYTTNLILFQYLAHTRRRVWQNATA